MRLSKKRFLSGCKIVSLFALLSVAILVSGCLRSRNESVSKPLRLSPKYVAGGYVHGRVELNFFNLDTSRVTDVSTLASSLGSRLRIGLESENTETIARIGEDSTFNFTDLAPGSYILTLEMNDASGRALRKKYGFQLNPGASCFLLVSVHASPRGAQPPGEADIADIQICARYFRVSIGNSSRNDTAEAYRLESEEVALVSLSPAPALPVESAAAPENRTASGAATFPTPRIDPAEIKRLIDQLLKK